MKKIKVSIIIPVYGVERYIERCAHSLFGQTMDENIEFIFVNDCTKDRSIEILKNVIEKYPNRKDQVKIIRHEQNLGVSQSRQDGLEAALGEYIIYCDPDDWVELDMYEQLYNKAKEMDSDIIICDYIEERSTRSNIIIQNIPLKEYLVKDVAMGCFHMSCWNKLISRSFIEKGGIKFIKGGTMLEDLAFNLPLIYSTNKIAKLNYAPYHYNVDIPNSIVKRITYSRIDSEISSISYITDFFRGRLKKGSFNEKGLYLLKFFAKEYYLMNGPVYNPDRWRTIFPIPILKILMLPISFRRKLICISASLKLDIITNYLSRFRMPINIYSTSTQTEL